MYSNWCPRYLQQKFLFRRRTLPIFPDTGWCWEICVLILVGVAYIVLIIVIKKKTNALILWWVWLCIVNEVINRLSLGPLLQYHYVCEHGGNFSFFRDNAILNDGSFLNYFNNRYLTRSKAICWATCFARSEKYLDGTSEEVRYYQYPFFN